MVITFFLSIALSFQSLDFTSSLPNIDPPNQRYQIKPTCVPVKKSYQNMLLTFKIIDASCPVVEFFVTIKAWRTSKIISNCTIHYHHLSERMKLYML